MGGGRLRGETGCCYCAMTVCVRPVPTHTSSRVAKIAFRRLRLLGRRVIAGLCVDAKGREPFGWPQFDLDFSPRAVARGVAWFVSKDILVAKLHPNFRSDVR